MSQTLFHGEQDIRVAAGLDINHPVRMESREMQGGREQVTPPQAPQDRPLDARQNAGEEDRRTGIVGQVGTAGNLMQRAARDPAAGQPRIDGVYPERD